MGLRESVLKKFEKEMLERSAIKVKDSAAAAEFLHSEMVLAGGNAPRKRILKNENLKIFQEFDLCFLITKEQIKPFFRNGKKWAYAKVY